VRHFRIRERRCIQHRFRTISLTGEADDDLSSDRNSERCPTHPGALLRDEVIPATGRTKTNIARLLGISRQHLHDILEERKPVSAEVAVRLGKLFGNDSGLYYRMQAAHDLWRASRSVDVSGIPTLSAA
jgi:addiction module HigA family antidote